MATVVSVKYPISAWTVVWNFRLRVTHPVSSAPDKATANVFRMNVSIPKQDRRRCKTMVLFRLGAPSFAVVKVYFAYVYEAFCRRLAFHLHQRRTAGTF